MKILIINSRYFLSAGPERYLFGLEEILKKEGHQTVIFSTKNSNNKPTQFENYFADPIGGKDKVYFSEYKLSPKTSIEILGRLFYSFHVKRKLDRLIKDTEPDVAYLLHHYNKLSPSVIDACKNNNLKVVMRLSDFFIVCPEGHLFREGKPCEECIKKGLNSAIRHSCVKGSKIASFLKSSALWFQRKLGIYDKIDGIVSPSKFTIAKVSGILDKEKIRHIPTFINCTEMRNDKVGGYILHVGRIEKQKGILDAIKAVKGTKMVLKIVGNSSTGYDLELKAYAKDMRNVEFLGPKYGHELKKLYKNARIVVIPARWYENMPNVALEAMHYSRPIIASDLGSLKDIVIHGKTGLRYMPGDIKELKRSLELLHKDDVLCGQLGENAYSEIKNTYDPANHYKELMNVFNYP